MSLSGYLAQNTVGMSLGDYYIQHYEPVEQILNRKRADVEKSLAAKQQELADINAAIDVVTDHPHIAKLINVLRKVGL